MPDEINIDIIMLSNFDPNGGGRETWLYNFLPEFLRNNNIGRVNLFGYKQPKDLNFKKELLAFESENRSPESLYTYILEGTPSKLPLAFSMFRKLRKLSKTIPTKNNVTLAMGVFEMVMMFYISRFKKTKKIVWLRSIFIHEKAYAIPKFLRSILLRFEIRLLRKADTLVCNGEDIRDFYQHYGLKLTVIKNGVDIKRWKQDPPKLIDPIHIAYIGRLSQVKGIESYFELIHRIKSGKQSENFVFHIVGDSNVYESTVDEMVQKKWVVMHGVIANKKLPQFLANIDVCVALTFASSSGGGGGTSNAMLEQMAASRIIIAWDNVIFQQYLNLSNAYLAEQYSVVGLEKALTEIIGEKETAKQKAKKAYETVLPLTYASNVEQFYNLLKV